MLPIKKIYIDTRFRSSDSASHSDFHIDLPTTFLMPEDTGFYIDDVCIPHSWYTVNANVNDRVFFYYGNQTLQPATVPEGIYNITNLALVIAQAMNTTLNLPVFESEAELKTNVIRISLKPAYANSSWSLLTDAELKAGNFTASLARSMNTLIKNFTSKGYNNQDFVSGYVDLVPMRNLYLSASGLGNFNTMTITGDRNIVKKIPVNASPGDVIFDQTVTGMDYLDCSGQTLSRISFKLKDIYGNAVDLHGNHFSFSIVFSRVQNGS